jgi:carnitine-CoA ligase
VCREPSAVLVSVGSLVWSAPERPDDADNPLRHVAMAPVIPESRRFEQRFGVRVSSLYGMTEIGPMLKAQSPEDHRVIGRPVGGYEVRLADPEGNPPPDGTAGELVVRHPEQLRAMSGYLGMPTETAEAWRGGWFHTGDLFERTESGEYRFVDRLKDCIRRHGRNISSFEIETEARSHPAVAQCAAVGFSGGSGSAISDDEVKLFVVLRPGTALTARALSEFLADRLPRYMVPRFLETVDSLPVGTAGRPNKVQLRTRPNTAETFDRYASDRCSVGENAET